MDLERRHGEFLDLFARHARRVQGYIYSLLPHWADADDVFQEASRVLWEKFADFQEGGDFFAWACRIAHFEVLAFRQKQARSRVTFSDEFLLLVAQTAETNAELLEAQHQALARCVEKLGPAERQLLLQRYGDATTTQQMAATLGRSVEALYKSLQRSRLRLLKCIEQTLKLEGFE